MAEYIEREAAIETIKNLYPSMPLVKLNVDKWHEKNKAYMECEIAIETIPAADVRPVVRGKWIESKSIMEVLYCSECGFRTIYGAMPDGLGRNYSYCPNCGADMREES